VVVWLRQDLRICDNPALGEAAASRRTVVPLYLLDEDTPGRWRMGGASRWWLEGSLRVLAAQFKALGSPLILRRGRADRVIPDFLAEIGAHEIYWSRCYEPFARARDEALKTALKAIGVTARSFKSALLFEPFEIKTKTGTDFRVYSPFARACMAMGVQAPLTPAPSRLIAPKAAIPSDDLASWELTPTAPDWAGGLRANWRPGEAGAKARLAAFIGKIADYKDGRDAPARDATSRLSPHLHFGEISPLQVWRALEGVTCPNGDKARTEVLWREFSNHLLFHTPTLPEQNWRAAFDAFPWRDARAELQAWRRGKTGIPIVDAGMRELWQTGWMHNRVRMITASFLIKHLLIDWRAGQDWFWDTLVDADLASNAASWQWVAGSGADAAPYFRVFNPVTQGQTHDPDGAYVRRFVPELARLPNALIHQPWTGHASILAAAGVHLGRNYPFPMVDLISARDRALSAFATIKKAA
jgi:deoxyribodipyrimidine photo-lyase